mmetsp:Transcript_24115/g.39876  ORF Transcript_24115/g.39876 Transcript_24115/m.39876 type:complete len:85 (-) Transcript_24115:307-561(-)
MLAIWSCKKVQSSNYITFSSIVTRSNDNTRRSWQGQSSLAEGDAHSTCCVEVIRVDAVSPVEADLAGLELQRAVRQRYSHLGPL